MYSWQLSNLESDGIWTPEWDPTINPKQPTAFTIEKTLAGLELVCDGPPDSGQLAKCVSIWLSQSQVPNIEFDLEEYFGDDIEYAQVIESDTKFTDASGFTYDGSFQLNIAEGWIAQIGNPWKNTPAKFPLTVDTWNGLAIRYGFDYINHELTIPSANGQLLAMPAIPAQNVGWAPNTIVTQLQLCIGAVAGAYSVAFRGIGYKSIP
jgi:hypothetical protein